VGETNRAIAPESNLFKFFLAMRRAKPMAQNEFFGSAFSAPVLLLLHLRPESMMLDRGSERNHG
jgi:hypothetical protein